MPQEELAEMKHDVNNRLNTILGYGELLRTADLPADARADAQAIVTAAKELRRLTHQLYDWCEAQ